MQRRGWHAMQHALATADRGLTVDAHDGDLATPARARTVCHHYNTEPEAGQAMATGLHELASNGQKGGRLDDAVELGPVESAVAIDTQRQTILRSPPRQFGLRSMPGISSAGSQLLSMTCLASCWSRWGTMSW